MVFMMTMLIVMTLMNMMALKTSNVNCDNYDDNF